MVRYEVFRMKFEVFDAGEVERPWAKLFLKRVAGLRARNNISEKAVVCTLLVWRKRTIH
jgi:hypothetical protein